jgi:homocysteine S-methyltransferase
MATELEARGCDLADSLWSAKVLLENPQLIRDVHLDYFRAGAQVAITASYQATPAGFAARGLDDAQSRALIGKSVELARKAREAYLAENPQAGTLLVAGSVGPYGAFRRRLGVSRRLSAQRGRVPGLPPPARRSAAGCGRRPAGL